MVRDKFSEVSCLERVCRSLTHCVQVTLIGKEMRCASNFGDMNLLKVADQYVLYI